MNPVAVARVALVFGTIGYQLAYGSKPQVAGGTMFSSAARQQSIPTQSYNQRLYADDYINLFL
jgi:hypothetical protein